MLAGAGQELLPVLGALRAWGEQHVTPAREVIAEVPEPDLPAS